jgi:hypothetical protein
MVAGGIRRPDGTGTAVRQLRHPDALVEAVRWAITKGAVLQAIGRARGVQRTDPVRITLLAELVLPLPRPSSSPPGGVGRQPSGLSRAASSRRARRWVRHRSRCRPRPQQHGRPSCNGASHATPGRRSGTTKGTRRYPLRPGRPSGKAPGWGPIRLTRTTS